MKAALAVGVKMGRVRMVTGSAETLDEQKDGAERVEGAAGGGTQGRPGGRGGFRRLVEGITRLTDLQYQIWLVQAKMTAARVVWYVALVGGAVVLGLVGIVFLYIGVFRLLMDGFGLPGWETFLILAGVHLVTAGVLGWAGMRKIRGSGELEDAEVGTGDKG